MSVKPLSPCSPLYFEVLEDRCTPATLYWDGGGPTNLASDPQNWVGDVLPTAEDVIRFDIEAPWDSVAHLDPAFGSTFAGFEWNATPGKIILSQDLVITGTAQLFSMAGILQGPGKLMADTTKLSGGTIENVIEIAPGKALEIDMFPTVKGEINNSGQAVVKPWTHLKVDGGVIRNNANSTWTLGDRVTVEGLANGYIVNKGQFTSARPDDPVELPFGSRITSDFFNTDSAVLEVKGKLAFVGGTLTQDSDTATISLPHLDSAGGLSEIAMNASRELSVQYFELFAGFMQGPGTLESAGVKHLGRVLIAHPDAGNHDGWWLSLTSKTVRDLSFTIAADFTATYQPTNDLVTVFTDTSIYNQGRFEILKDMRVFAGVDAGFTNTGIVSQDSWGSILLDVGSTQPWKIYNAGSWVKEFSAGQAPTVIQGKFANASVVEVRGGGLRLEGGGEQSGLYELEYEYENEEGPQVAQADLTFGSGNGINQNPLFEWKSGLQFHGGDDFLIRNGARVSVQGGVTINVPGDLKVYGGGTEVLGPGSIEAVSLYWQGANFVGLGLSEIDPPSGSLTAGIIRVEEPIGLGEITYGVKDRYSLIANDGIIWDAAGQEIAMRRGASIITREGASVINPPAIIRESQNQIEQNYVEITGGTWGANPSQNYFVFGQEIEFRNNGATVELGGHDFQGGYVQSNGLSVLHEDEAIMGAPARISGGTLKLEGGTLAVDAPAVLTLEGAELVGHGTINGDVSAVDSTIRVGTVTWPQVCDYGNLAISGQFTQIRGTTHFYLGGSALGVSYGQLQVGGNVNMNDATVNINLVAFQPPIGSRYSLIAAPNANALTPTVTGLDFGAPDREFELDPTVASEFAIVCVLKN